MPSYKGSSQPKDWTQVCWTAGRFFTAWATREAQEYWNWWTIPSPRELPDPGIEPGSPALRADFLSPELRGNICYGMPSVHQQQAKWRGYSHQDGFFRGSVMWMFILWAREAESLASYPVLSLTSCGTLGISLSLLCLSFFSFEMNSLRVLISSKFQGLSEVVLTMQQVDLPRRNTSLIPESGRCPGGGHGNPLKYSYLENPIVRQAWQAMGQSVTKTWTC